MTEHIIDFLGKYLSGRDYLKRGGIVILVLLVSLVVVSKRLSKRRDAGQGQASGEEKG